MTLSVWPVGNAHDRKAVKIKRKTRRLRAGFKVFFEKSMVA
jgi:hypothetical protein